MKRITVYTPEELKRKYHTKAYGGGIVFQSYNIRELEKDILKIVSDTESK